MNILFIFLANGILDKPSNYPDKNYNEFFEILKTFLYLAIATILIIIVIFLIKYIIKKHNQTKEFQNKLNQLEKKIIDIESTEK